jgi:hypothetical protein
VFSRLPIGLTHHLSLVSDHCVILTANLIVALCWHVILSAERLRHGPGGLMRLVLVGLFCNQVVPTGVRGAAVRGWRYGKLGIDLGAAIRSILLDRGLIFDS